MHADKVGKGVHSRFSFEVVAESEKKPKVKRSRDFSENFLLSVLLFNKSTKRFIKFGFVFFIVNLNIE